MKETELKIKDHLDSLYAKYGKSYLETDPVAFVHRFSAKDDIEVVGFLCALLAFGNVPQIKRSLEDLLSRLGDCPAEFVRNFGMEQRVVFAGFRHRFVGEDQMTALVRVVGKLLRGRGSIKNAFADCYSPGDLTGSLSRFVEKMKRAAGERGKPLKFLLPDPQAGSACKRLFLFLRWMVRKDDGVDFGIFDTVSPAELIIPLDTHIARISNLFGFTKKKSKSLSTAIEITERLKRYDPQDPVKYDFALTRIGIVEGCLGVYSQSACFLCEAGLLCKMLRTESD